MTNHDSLVNSQVMAVQRLPEFDPDPALWERIRAGNTRRLRRRWIRQAAGLGLGLAIVVLVGLHETRESGQIASDVREMTDGRMHSQRLQDALRSSGTGPIHSSLQSRLRLVDSELQAAYDHGAGETELQSLWALRNQLLETLVDGDGELGHQLTRI